MEEKLLLVDGNSLLYRAFFALPPLSHQGTPLNAVHGFYIMLLTAIKENMPTGIYVMFDESKPTFRHQEYDAYKAGRPPAPDDLRTQFTLIREFLTACNIPALSQAGFEADDLLGTAAKLAEKEGVSSIILTGDRDALQLATAHTSILITKKGISESLLLNPEGVKTHYGVTPEQIKDLKGLMGDKSDNIPGIAGVGEKTALKLLDEYGSLENILENAHNIKGKLGEKLKENERIARFSKKLATIFTEAPIQIDVHLHNAYDLQQGLPTFAHYRLNRVSSQITALYAQGGVYEGKAPLAQPSEVNLPIPTTVASNSSASVDDVWHLVHLPKNQHIALETQPKNNTIVCQTLEDVQALQFKANDYVALYLLSSNLSLFAQNAEIIIPLKQNLIDEGVEKRSALLEVFNKLTPCQIICHNQKALWHALQSEKLPPSFQVVWDTMIANYMLESSQGDKSLEELTQNHHSAFDLYQLACHQYLQLKDTSLYKLALFCEFPLSKVLFSMENAGFEVDRRILNELSQFFTTQIETLQNLVYEQTGFDGFNLNSPKQLSEILFERMNLPHGKKTKSGYSTNAESLEKIAHLSPAIDSILEYRKFTKLKSTYIDALLELTKHSTRIHTSLEQTGTVTGRISSIDPNLQNIPVRSKEGAEIRKAFVAREGYTLVDADYSQIELRVLAHLSNDTNLINAFNSGQDIHTITASEIFGVPINEVTPTLRSNAKAVNFGIVYGISSFGLAKNTNISFKEAEKFIAMYFERYPGVRDYMDNCVDFAKEHGEIYTLFGRRRGLPEMQSKNANMVQFGKRIAMNTPVQGTAADIIKFAMIRVQDALKAIPHAELILQVHDELIVECKQADAQRVQNIIKECMENVVSLKVPLVVEAHIAHSWYDAK